MVCHICLCHICLAIFIIFVTHWQSQIFAGGSAGHLYWSKGVIVEMTTQDCESRPQIYLSCLFQKPIRIFNSCYIVIFSAQSLSYLSHNQPPRIPPTLSFFFFFFFFCSSVTLRVPPLYLGNQVWYHRSAGVKTTGKKI